MEIRGSHSVPALLGNSEMKRSSRFPAGRSMVNCAKEYRLLCANLISSYLTLTEVLKAENQMLWVQKTNNLRNAAMEIASSELIYC